jgi:hypothetical protein
MAAEAVVMRYALARSNDCRVSGAIVDVVEKGVRVPGVGVGDARFRDDGSLVVAI